MSASNAFETDVLKLIFQNVDFAGLGDAGGLRGSVSAGNLYVSLHTADPGEAGDQSTGECAYTGYTRVGVARSASGWTVTGNNVSNASPEAFPECAGGSETATHFGIGTEASGGGKLLFSAALDDNLAISSGITPEFAAGNLGVSVD